MKQTMKMTGLAVLFICINLFSMRLEAQSIPRSRIDSIRNESISFLIKQDYLEKGKTLNEYLKRIYFSELNSEATLGFNGRGIYVFGVSTSHTKRFFLILDANRWKIMDAENIGVTLRDACDFSLENALPEKEIINYAKRIVEIYEYNQTF